MTVVRADRGRAVLSIKTLKSAGWTVSSKLLGRGIDFFTLLILARYLSPSDFGLTALATSLIMIVEMVLEIPLVQALTRLKTLEKKHLDTAFTLGFLRGLLLLVVICGASWPAAAMYDESRLQSLMMALGVSAFMRGLISPGMVYFMRDLSFGRVFFIQVVGKVLAAIIAIALLFNNGGYWAIAGFNVAAAIITCVLSYIVAPYVPAFSLSRFRAFAGFVGWFSLSQLVMALISQMDRVILGGGVNQAVFGRYTMAGDLAVMPTQSLIGPAMQPVMAAFAKFSDDKERLKGAFLKAARVTMLLSAPACLYISLAADEIIALLFDDKWKDAAIFLQLLALTVLPNAYFQPLYSMALAMDRPRVLFNITVIDLVVRTLFTVAGLYLFSIWGVIGARGIVSIIMMGVTIWITYKLIGLRIIDQINNLIPVAVACLSLLVVTEIVYSILSPFNLPVLVILALTGTAAGLSYLAGLYVCGVRMNNLMNVSFGATKPVPADD